MNQQVAPSSMKEAQQMLTNLNLPAPPPNVLTQISQDEGSQFKQAIIDATSGASNGKTAFDYLATVLRAYSPFTANVIRRLGFRPPTPQQLLQVIRQEPKAFGAAIKTLSSNFADKDTGAYLRTLLAPLNLEEFREPQRSEPRPPDTMRPTADITYHPTANENQRDTQNSQSREPYCGDGEPNPVRPDIVSTHLYGQKAAFCFTKDFTQTGRHPTVTIDAALAIPNKERSYDWKNKCAFQLSVSELPLVYGIFIGDIGEVKLVGHGRANNKSLQIADQGKNYYLTMQHGREQSFAIPAYAKDTFRIMTLLLEQMKANSPSLTSAEIMHITKRICAKHVNPQQAQRAAAS